MMKRAKTTFSAVFFCMLASVALSVAAQTAGYTKLNVKGRVQLEVPSNWTISDAEHRRRVKEFAEKATGVANEHVASLSVQSYPAPSGPRNTPVIAASLGRSVIAIDSFMRWQ